MLSIALLILTSCNGPEPVDDTGPEGDTDTDTDTDTDVDSDVEDCDVQLSSSQDLCYVHGEGTDLVLRGHVLGPEGRFEGGAVRIEDGTITCVGCDCSLDDAVVLDCAEGVISPGLINLHDHIGYTEGAPIDHGETRYEHRHGWRGSLSTPQNDESLGKAWGEVRMLLSGTTSMIGSGWAEGMVRNLDRWGSNENLGLDEIENQTFPLGDSNESFQDDCGWDFRDTESSIYRETAYVPHIAEGVDDYAEEEFRCTATSLEGGEDMLQGNVAYVHAIGLKANDIYRMSLEETSVIWSPRSNISLYGHTADVLTMDRLGVNLALGTDWTYSGSINMARELACADSLNRLHYDNSFSDRQLWEMATVNPAQAVQTDHLIGSLQPGLVADIAVFDGRETKGYRAVITADSTDVGLVLRAGEPLYGEGAIMQALDSGCEELEICGTQRAICAEQEFGTAWDSLASTMSGAYGAFFCSAEPTDEPTCVPSRPGEFPLASDDADGDGLADSEDNCPSVFNPIRPMDDGVQSDQDDDGLGDPCDEDPIKPDLDGDGQANADDNCPFDANADQADDDADGTGDVCDVCPETSNPDSICPEAVVQVYAIQKGEVAEGTDVRVEGLVVTGLVYNGFGAQHAEGGQYSGIFVYTDTDPGVSVGDLVNVDGTTTEYYGETEIVAMAWEVTGTGSATPQDLTAEDAADEAWEGVLVTVSGSVTNSAYDCSVDGADCKDEGLWEIAGSAGVVVYDKYYTDSDWADHVGQTPVTGVMGYRWDRRRLMPRSGSDF